MLTSFFLFVFIFVINPAFAEESMTIHHSKKCFVISNDTVELAVTEIGGHMAPVKFYRHDKQSICPYYISPWQDEADKEMPVPVLVSLRGDFFCLPFGGNSEAVHGEKHPPHGEAAGSIWKYHSSLKKGNVSTLSLSLETQIRQGVIRKHLSLVDGHNVIYSTHEIEGFTGKVPLGHHATLAMPEQEGAVKIYTSKIRFGMTYPDLFSDPKSREYQSLQPGTKWDSLQKVPRAWKGSSNADLSEMPGPKGYADLIQVVNDPNVNNQPAWTIALFKDQGFLWFSLKDPEVLNSTVFWMENHGRHGHPWNGRNNCLGLEDVTAYFADGLAASTKDNLLNQAGVSTTVDLQADKPTKIHYIQGALKLPENFTDIQDVGFQAGKINLISTSGQIISAPVRHEFLKSGILQ